MDLTKIKDIIYILGGFITIIAAIITFGYFVLRKTFVLKSDLEVFCKAQRDTCNAQWCRKIDGLDKKIANLEGNTNRMQLWLVQTITLIADKLDVPIEQLRQ